MYSILLQLALYQQAILSPAQGNSAIYLGVDVNQNYGIQANQCTDADNINRGLVVYADGNTLSFNCSVIAGIGTTGSANNGSVNYSAGNPILCGVSIIGTEEGFYSDGVKVYWRAIPVPLGSVPP
ncbi:MAG: hypothetical protein EZS28_004534 [Streblomastix strix]|uniref:Uncharacterized protein n=1 Tax=Streblomastix strix TaxID=222440 RepID=A0A5J4WXY4_9EUKA|nr:MAG: hypothetical protein EZS28_004534 [Streblomastix strix]